MQNAEGRAQNERRPPPVARPPMPSLRVRLAASLGESDRQRAASANSGLLAVPSPYFSTRRKYE